MFSVGNLPTSSAEIASTTVSAPRLVLIAFSRLRRTPVTTTSWSPASPGGCVAAGGFCAESGFCACACADVPNAAIAQPEAAARNEVPRMPIPPLPGQTPCEPVLGERAGEIHHSCLSNSAAWPDQFQGLGHLTYLPGSSVTSAGTGRGWGRRRAAHHEISPFRCE